MSNMSAHKEVDESEDDPMPPQEELPDSPNSLGTVRSMSASEAETLSQELHHMWDNSEHKNQEILQSINRRFDEVVGNFPDNEDSFADEETVLTLRELFHWLANLAIPR